MEIMDIEDREFEELLAEKRHKELYKSLKDIAIILSQPAVHDKKILEAISKGVSNLEVVISTIKEKDYSPSINLDNSNIFLLLKEIKSGNDRVLNALENRVIVDEFKIQTTDQWTKTIKVIYKKSKVEDVK